MNMKQPIVIVAAMTLGFGFSAEAQSLEQGIKMYQYERYESAKKELEPLAGTDPVANYYLGLAELGLEHTDQAQAIFAKNPEDAANMAGLARVAYTKGDANEGARLAKAVADKAGRKAWEPLRYAADAINYTDGGNKQQAIDWYEEAVKRKDNHELRIALGDAYQQISTGGGKAMNNYEKVTGADPKNSLAWSRTGALWYAAKNYQLALESYQKAKDADPSNPLPYRDLANAYFWTGKYNLAKENIEKYLSLSDKSVDDQIRYAEILYLAKDYQGAVQTAEELLGKGVTKPGLYGILAYSNLELKNHEKALQFARQYLQVQKPERIFPMDYLNVARIYLGAGASDTVNNYIDSANQFFTKAINADTASNKSDTYRQIAEGFKDAKDYVRSAEWYNKLVRAYPETQPLDYFWAGAMHYYSKNYDSAAVAFQAMEAKYPEQPSAVYWQGRIAAAIDNEAKEGLAVPHYTRWLDSVGVEYDKKNDLMYAFQYLALYYYNKNDQENLKKFMTLIEAIEPENAFLKQLKDLVGAKKS